MDRAGRVKDIQENAVTVGAIRARRLRGAVDPVFRILFARLLETTGVSRAEIMQILDKKSRSHVTRLLQGAVPLPTREQSDQLADALQFDRDRLWLSILREKAGPEVEAYFTRQLEEERDLAKAVEPEEMALIEQIRETSRRFASAGVQRQEHDPAHQREGLAFVEKIVGVLLAEADGDSPPVSEPLMASLATVVSEADPRELLLLFEILTTVWSATDGPDRLERLRRVRAALRGLADYVADGGPRTKNEG